ncbi:MAG: EAL domain-containing protein, partial [Zoogloea sp.]|nr:EAL domain-containing protein [Zoogloea sp.]
PDKFIPLAEQSGLIVDIGAWVLLTACKECCAWHEKGHPDLVVSVNVSAVQFREPRLIEVVKSALATAGLPGAALQLEVTETSMMEDAETAIGMLRALKSLGVRIALDDFGTGYSSLAYLKRFPIDVIKIDKSFVKDVCMDEDSAAIARAIVALARSMRRKTLAEGIEDAEQAAFLLAERCDVFQGYFFGRPMPAEDFRRRVGEPPERLCTPKPDKIHAVPEK